MTRKPYANAILQRYPAQAVQRKAKGTNSRVAWNQSARSIQTSSMAFAACKKNSFIADMPQVTLIRTIEISDWKISKLLGVQKRTSRPWKPLCVLNTSASSSFLPSLSSYQFFKVLPRRMLNDQNETHWERYLNFELNLHLIQIQSFLNLKWTNIKIKL